VIGELVKARRRARGFTQVQLGVAAGLSQDYISKLERGDIDLPQRGTLEALGRPLALTLADFYRAAGILGPDDPAPDPGANDDPLSLMVERVRTNPEIMRQLRALEEASDPAVFERTLAAVAEAWQANLRMGINVAEAQRGAGGPGTDVP
jgi:transcriptional regulator with XRE-family HTH domain